MEKKTNTRAGCRDEIVCMPQLIAFNKSLVVLDLHFRQLLNCVLNTDSSYILTFCCILNQSDELSEFVLLVKCRFFL